CKDATGADGMVFVLQPISTSIGTIGSGIGFMGVTPSIGVTIDTWQNTDINDPSYDHIAIHKNGNLDHLSGNNLAGPVTAIDGNDNIEDCKWHILGVSWDAVSKTLKADIDGVERVKSTIDLVNDVFSGDPKVFWGFTAATGGANNHQRFCTSLNPGFTLPPGQQTCFPTPIQFVDSSASFGSILKWYWDFGDGSIDSLLQTPPAHLYPRPGNYDVSLKILGNNGCLSDTFTRRITVGSKPVADFNYLPLIACQNIPIDFKDLSHVEYGTINNWLWDIGGQRSFAKTTSFSSNLPLSVPAQLEVRTKEGCVADITKQMIINAVPRVDFNATEICADSSAKLFAINLDPGIAIRHWNWDFGDWKKDNGNSVQHIYTKGGSYDVQLMAIADNGCSSIPVNKKLIVHKTSAFAGYDTIAAQGQTITLQGSGDGLFRWSPTLGLSDPTVLNPIATLQRDAVYILTAYSPIGCSNADTVKIRVYKGPEFYVPNAFTPNGDEKNDRLRCLAVGMANIDFFKVYNRYGQLIFSSVSYQPGWDGTNGGVKQPSGTYVWMARGKDITGKWYLKKGTVTLIR
ncbi:MAG: lectin-like domain-containing protein, partial [Flavitalea sp.]